MTVLELKTYQRATLDALTAWLKETVATGDPDTAFYALTRRPYAQAQGLPDVPHACLRVPTGGGKTLIAAHAIGRAADTLLTHERPTVIWLAPSNAIVSQTLAALKSVQHPYARALAARFGHDVRVMTIDEALAAGRADYDGGCVVIVGTIQSFRQEETEGRRVYADNGALMDHFSGRAASELDRLERGSEGQIVRSLANALKLRRPMVIVDEAHNARTILSFATLARLSPSLIIELTATPAADSNILHHVSAAELKDEAMIKLPIRLRSNADWREVLRLAKARLEELTEAAAAERLTGGAAVHRPVMLIQAQARRGPAPLTPDVVRTALIQDFQVPADQIKIATGSDWELDGVDLRSWTEPTRFIITVQALREGWDCPGAYVLATLAHQQSATAVEQILGRIMRLPGAAFKSDPRLNQAYAFAATESFSDAANALAEGLVANGFERLEAKSLVRPDADQLHLPPPRHESDTVAGDIDLTPYAAIIAAETEGRVALDVGSRRLAAASLTATDRARLALTLPPLLQPAYDSLVRRLDAAEKQAERPVVATRKGFTVPLLAVRRGAQLEIFDRGHFLDHPWALDRCDASAVLSRFVPPPSGNREAVIDVEAATSQIRLRFVEQLQAEIALAVDDREWPLPQLVRWLDRQLQPAKGSDVTQSSAQAFIRAGLDALLTAGGHSIGDLRRWRFRLVEAFSQTIESLRDERETQAFEGALFGRSVTFEPTPPDLSHVFDPDRYYPTKPYAGRAEFQRHIVPSPIHEMNDDEVKCALALDLSNQVDCWVRNIERLPSSFHLQIARGRFFPDFVARRTDGVILVIEHKGGQIDGSIRDRTEEKQMVGERWAAVTGNRFVMSRDGDVTPIQQALVN